MELILPDPGMRMLKMRQTMATGRGNTGMASFAEIVYFRFTTVAGSSFGIIVSLGI